MIRFIYTCEDRLFYWSISRTDWLGRWAFGRASVAVGNVGDFFLRRALRRQPAASRSSELSALALTMALDRRS